MLNKTDQESLYTNLGRRSEKLARIYRGALAVLGDEDNPCRYELAAHNLRELIEKSPLLANGEAFVQGDGMKNRLYKARKLYNAIMGNQKFEETSPLDFVDGAIRGLLNELAQFFEWQDENRPKRREKIAKHLSSLSGAGPLPATDYFEAEVTSWLQADQYFKNVAHYNQPDGIDRDEFLRHMNLIETSLLRQLQPPSVEQLEELDALIKEAEDDH